MKLRSKLTVIALFAGIFWATVDTPANERRAFAFSAPSQVALEFTLDLASTKVAVTPLEQRSLQLAQK